MLPVSWSETAEEDREARVSFSAGCQRPSAGTRPSSGSGARVSCFLFRSFTLLLVFLRFPAHCPAP